MLAFDLPYPQRVQAPMLVLGAQGDRIFTPREANATASAYKTTASVFPHMAHDMMLEAGWQEVADAILTWLAERGI